MLHVLFRVEMSICLPLESVRVKGREREWPLSCWLVCLAASKEEVKRGREMISAAFYVGPGWWPGQNGISHSHWAKYKNLNSNGQAIPAQNNNLKFFLLQFYITFYICGTIISINVCVYIYVYIYMDVCVWISVCVRGWVAKEGMLSSVSLTGVRVSRGTSLSTLTQRLHKELCPRKPVKPEKKGEGCQSLKSETPKRSVRYFRS